MADELITFNDAGGASAARSAVKKKKRKRARPWAFWLGLVMAVLTLVGLVSVVLIGVDTVKRAVARVQNVEGYNKMLVPVVMNDPDMFDDISKADMSQLLDISIWSILRGELSPDKYEYDGSNMIIPEDDVTAEYTKLFGTEVPPVHATVSGYGYEFTYNAAEKTYSIPLTGIEPTYTPRVTDVDKKSNTIVLTVAYIAGNGWAQDSQGNMIAPEPDKYVKVTLREADGNYYINSMQMTSTPETATASVTAAPETTASPETTEVSTEEQTSGEADTEAQTGAEATEIAG